MWAAVAGIGAAALTLVGMSATIWAIKKFSEEASLAYLPAWIAFAVGIGTLAWFVRRCLRFESGVQLMPLALAAAVTSLLAPVALGADRYALDHISRPLHRRHLPNHHHP